MFSFFISDAIGTFTQTNIINHAKQSIIYEMLLFFPLCYYEGLLLFLVLYADYIMH